MNDLRTFASIRAETEPTVQAQLTAIRGKIRRAPKGVQKEQLKLLAWQLCQQPPVKFIQRQIGIIASRSQH